MLCKIGDVEIWRILESQAPFLTPEELFPSAGLDVRDIVESFVPGGLCRQSGKLILPIQAFLLKTLSHNILVDCCVGNDKTVPGMPDWHQRSDGRFVAALAAAGIGFADVDYVLCTHLHTDHIGWNTRLVDGRWVPTFPKARYLMPASDEATTQVRESNMYAESVLPVIDTEQADLVQAGHVLGDHVKLLPTPGHTPGHVSVRIRSRDQEAVIAGDALHSTVQCRYPEWHFKYDSDPDLAVRSRRWLLEMASETNCRMLGCHFALPSIGRVNAEKGAFIWRAD